MQSELCKLWNDWLVAKVEPEWRRYGTRKPCHGTFVEIRIDGGEPQGAKLRDVGERSVGLLTRTSTPDHTPIAVSYNGEWHEGITRHCTQTINGYRVGIRLFAESWDTEEPEPAGRVL